MNAITPISPAEPIAEDLVETRRLPQAPASWSAEAWTVEATLSTPGAAVTRYDARGEYSEVLDLDQTWPAQIPLLDSHRRDSIGHRLGSVDNLRVVGGELLGRVTLSRHNPLSQQVAAEIADGHGLGVSIGYITREQREQANPSTKRREKIATRFELLEASLVTIPADRLAGLRSQSMTVTPAPVAQQPVTPPAPAPDATATQVLERSVIATAPAVDRAAINGEIRSIARLSGLDQGWIDQQIDTNASADEARRAAFEAMQTRAAPAAMIRTATISVGTDYTDPELRVRHVGEALYARTNPGHQLSEQARPFAGLAMMDVARECLRMRGIAVTGLSAMSIAERALHATSDFPLILGDTVGRTLREAYRAAPSGLKALGRKTTARDFRAKHRLQLSSAPKLEEVIEGGTFKYGTLNEAQETYRIGTFGKIFAISRQAIVNDDLGAFSDLARRFGQAAAATEADLLAGLLQADTGNGPTMSDGKALFHADHKNKAGTGAVLSLTTLSAARLALRTQVGLANDLIDVTPRHLLVPPALETAAEQLMTTLNPTKAEDTNPLAGKLAIAVEPRLTSATRWYVSADTASIDGLEYAYLEGEEGVQITTEAGFDVDGVKVKARLDFGAGFVDWRGWYTNAGA